MSGASSRFQEAIGVVLTTSSRDLTPIHPVNTRRETTRAYHLRLARAVNGSAAISATPAKSIGSRVTLEPICEWTAQTRTTARAYTPLVTRTVTQCRGTRTQTSTP